MKTFKVYKNETFVWKLVYSLLLLTLFSWSSAFAQDYKPPKTCLEIAQIALGCELPSTADKLKCFRDAKKECQDSDSLVKDNAAQCGELKKDWNERFSEFNSACGKSGMTGTGMTCAMRSNACSICTGTARGEDKYSDLCKKLDDENEFTAPQTDASGGYNGFDMFSVTQSTGFFSGKEKEKVKRTNPAELYANCPAFAAKDLEKKEDRLESIRDKVFEYEDDLIEKQATQKELEAKLQEKMAEAKAEMAKIQLQFKEQMKSLVRGSKTELEEFQKSLAALGAALSEVFIAKQQNQNNYDDAISAADLRCHNKAVTDVNKEREQRLASINAKTLSTSSMNRLFNSTGISSRKKSQNRAKRFYNECRRDRSYILARNQAKRLRDQTHQALVAQEKNVLQQQQQLIQKMGRLSPEFAEDRQALIDMTKQLMADKQRELTAAFKALQNLLQSTAMQSNVVQRRLGVEQGRLAQYESALAAANHYSQGSPVSDEDYSDVLAKSATMQGLAKNILETCSCVDVCQDDFYLTQSATTQVENSGSVCRAAATLHDDMNRITSNFCLEDRDTIGVDPAAADD